MESAHNIAAIAKKVNPEIIVVLGGNHISAAIRDYRYSKFEKDPKQILNFLPFTFP